MHVNCIPSYHSQIGKEKDEEYVEKNITSLGLDPEAKNEIAHIGSGAW